MLANLGVSVYRCSPLFVKFVVQGAEAGAGIIGQLSLDNSQLLLGN
jgi:hypothetical protein